MSRDNLLYITIGVLAGFISGYFTHEVMATRQPPPLAVLQAAQAAALGNPHAGGAPGAGGEGGGRGRRSRGRWRDGGGRSRWRRRPGWR